jgi:hypothetical protein
MADLIHGRVTQVFDGDTLELGVTGESPRNEYGYNPVDRVRIEGIDAPELPSGPGVLSKLALERCILQGSLPHHLEPGCLRPPHRVGQGAPALLRDIGWPTRAETLSGIRLQASELDRTCWGQPARSKRYGYVDSENRAPKLSQLR